MLLAASLTNAAAEEILRWEPRTVEWDAIGTAPGGRGVEIVFFPSFCDARRNRHVEVQETRTSVKITLGEEFAVYPPGRGIRSCPAPHETLITVSLARRLAGRRVYGRAQTHFPLYRRSNAVVPLLTGFAPQDAKHALSLERLSGVAVRGGGRHGGLRRVVGQTPLAGQRLAVGGVVRLRIGG